MSSPVGGTCSLPLFLLFMEEGKKKGRKGRRKEGTKLKRNEKNLVKQKQVESGSCTGSKNVSFLPIVVDSLLIAA